MHDLPVIKWPTLVTSAYRKPVGNYEDTVFFSHNIFQIHYGMALQINSVKTINYNLSSVLSNKNIIPINLVPFSHILHPTFIKVASSK